MDQQTTNKQTNGKSKRERVESPLPPLPLFLPSPFPFSPFPFPFFSHSRTRLLVFFVPSLLLFFSFVAFLNPTFLNHHRFLFSSLLLRFIALQYRPLLSSSFRNHS